MAVHWFVLFMARFETHLEENYSLSMFLILIQCFAGFPIFDIFIGKGNRNRLRSGKWV